MNNLIQHIRKSLALKISIGILLLAIPIFIASMGILFMQSRHFIKKEAIKEATSTLNTTTERISGFLRVIETATNANDWLVTDNLQPDVLLGYTRRIVMLNSYTNGCSITTEPNMFPQYGHYFSAYSVRQGDSIKTVREAEYNYFEKPWYKIPREKGKACWIDPFNDYNEGTLSASDMITSYCKPLYTDDGTFIGVIATDLSLPFLASTIQAEKPYPNAYFFLLGKNGHYFVHPDSSRLIKQTIFSVYDAQNNPEVIALGHEMTTGQRGSIRLKLDGKPCLVSYRPVTGTPWSLALVCPESDILKSYNRLSLIITPIIIVGLLLIMLLCNRIVTHAIRPVNRLLTQSQHIAQGRFNEQIATTKRRDVVGRLQNSFATMQESLNIHVTNISKANADTTQQNEQLRLAYQQVEESYRQKTAFIQNMTHQIRTPLNIIIGFAQVLRDSDHELPPDEIASIAEMMKHNSMLLHRMVLMLYDSSEMGIREEIKSNQDEEVVCNSIARECIDFAENYFPGLKIAFSTTLPDDFSIRSNSLYLLRSLREILYNSGKYSDGQHVSLQLSATKDTVRFAFQDTGSGIADNYKEYIFKPFTKVNDLSEGLGLGLPLSKQHVVRMGGTLTYDDTYREGCRIIIEMPRK